MARTMSVPCRRDLACYRNDGHEGDCMYATPETQPQPAMTDPTVDALARAWLNAMTSGDHNGGCLDQGAQDCPVGAEVRDFVPRVAAALADAGYVVVRAEEVERAITELDRLTAIIEGRGEARLIPPHGQTSARPRLAADRLRAALADAE